MKEAVIRLILLLFFLTNQLLMMVGYHPLPFSDEQMYEVASSLAMVLIALYTWWKNNNITKEAQAAQRYLDALKRRN